MSQISADTIKGVTSTNNITLGNTPIVSASANSLTIRGEGSAQTSVQQGLAKHWCKFNGTSTVAVIDSFNNSSLADNGTGLYTLTITNDFANVNYTSVDGGIYAVGGGAVGATGIASPYNAENTGTLAIGTRQGNDAAFLDYARVMINCHGDLA